MTTLCQDNSRTQQETRQKEFEHGQRASGNQEESWIPWHLSLPLKVSML
jgi:hypothetical protein